MQMKFIHIDEVIEQLDDRPELYRDKYISMILDMMDINEHCTVLPTILAYTILKHDEPDSQWDIRIHNNIVYLYSPPMDGIYVGNHPIDQPTIVSILVEEDIEDGIFDIKSIHDHNTVCVGTDILSICSIYKINGVSLPSTKGGLMKLLRRDGIVDDNNVDIVSQYIDCTLQDHHRHIDIFDDAYNNSILHLCISKILIVNTINSILDVYPTSGCKV